MPGNDDSLWEEEWYDEEGEGIFLTQQPLVIPGTDRLSVRSVEGHYDGKGDGMDTPRSSSAVKRHKSDSPSSPSQSSPPPPVFRDPSQRDLLPSKAKPQGLRSCRETKAPGEEELQPRALWRGLQDVKSGDPSEGKRDIQGGGSGEEEGGNSPHLSEEQQAAMDAVMEGKNVFITGKAGVGKSFLVQQACQAPTHPALCAIFTSLPANHHAASLASCRLTSPPFFLHICLFSLRLPDAVLTFSPPMSLFSLNVWRLFPHFFLHPLPMSPILVTTLFLFFPVASPSCLPCDFLTSSCLSHPNPAHLSVYIAPLPTSFLPAALSGRLSNTPPPPCSSARLCPSCERPPSFAPDNLSGRPTCVFLLSSDPLAVLLSLSRCFAAQKMGTAVRLPTAPRRSLRSLPAPVSRCNLHVSPIRSLHPHPPTPSPMFSLLAFPHSVACCSSRFSLIVLPSVRTSIPVRRLLLFLLSWPRFVFLPSVKVA